jgi:hypothetical protein
MKDLFNNIKLRKRVNTLEGEVEYLKNIIKEEAYKEFIKLYEQATKSASLEEQIKRLKERLKK